MISCLRIDSSMALGRRCSSLRILKDLLLVFICFRSLYFSNDSEQGDIAFMSLFCLVFCLILCLFSLIVTLEVFELLNYYSNISRSLSWDKENCFMGEWGELLKCYVVHL